VRTLVRMLDSTADAELARRLPGDAAAFEELFRRHRRSVIAYAARRCTQPADAADLVAATFLAVLEGGRGYDPARGPFRPWLIGVAHHQLGSLRQRDHHQWSISQAASGQRVLGEDATARIDERIDAARDTVDVEHAMAKLPERHQEVLWLVGHDQLTNQEAAYAQAVNVGVFRVRLSRARRALRNALHDPLPPDPTLSRRCSDDDL
jgi:RNA polymerase sigma factor (sigma-70 family)